MEPFGRDAGDRDLVERSRTDPAAFTILYRRYVGAVHAFSYRRSRSREVAEDVTSATFERALTSLSSFEWRGGGFAPWLFRIAANELADHYRKEQRVAVIAHALAAEAGIAGEDPPFMDDDSPTGLSAAIGRLNPRYQQALSLRFLAGLPHDEAAKAMGVSKPVMAVLVHRALGALRKQVKR